MERKSSLDEQPNKAETAENPVAGTMDDTHQTECGTKDNENSKNDSDVSPVTEVASTKTNSESINCSADVSDVEKEPSVATSVDLNGNQRTEKPTVEVHPMVVKKPLAKGKSSVSSPSCSKTDAVVDPIAEDSPLMLPFKLGWTRELVYRAQPSSTKADAYYRPPVGKKLRSMTEIERFIRGHEVLTKENFSFLRTPLGLNDPSKEIVRDAMVSYSSVPENRKSTPKKKTIVNLNRRSSTSSVNKSKKPAIEKLVISNINQPDKTCVKAQKQPTASQAKKSAPKTAPKPASISIPARKPNPQQRNQGKLKLSLPALFSTSDKVQQRTCSEIPLKAVKPMPLSKKLAVLKSAQQNPKLATRIIAPSNIKPVPSFKLIQRTEPPVEPNKSIAPCILPKVINNTKAYRRWMRMPYAGSTGVVQIISPSAVTLSGGKRLLASSDLVKDHRRSEESSKFGQDKFESWRTQIESSLAKNDLSDGSKRLAPYYMQTPATKVPKTNSSNPEHIVCEPELPDYADMILPEQDERADRKFSDFLAGKIVSPVSKSSLAIPGFPEFKRIKLVRQKSVHEDMSLDSIAEVITDDGDQPTSNNPIETAQSSAD